MTALTLDEVGLVVTYAAPGYAAQWAYRSRFPARDRPAGEVLLISAVLSLPFVALAGAILKGPLAPTKLDDVAVLLGPALVAGWLVAVIRPLLRTSLLAVGYAQQPEPSMWTRTLQHLPKGAWITVDFKDGTKVTGRPRSYPGPSEDGVNEIYLVTPRFESNGGFEADPEAKGLIVRLDEVMTITLSDDPTRALGST